MTIRQQFLILFADYREALDRGTKAEDEARHWKGVAEQAQTREREMTQRFLDRETKLNDSILGVKFGDRVRLTEEQIASAAAVPPERKDPQLSMRQERARLTKKFFQDLAARRAAGQPITHGPGQDQTRPN